MRAQEVSQPFWNVVKSGISTKRLPSKDKRQTRPRSKISVEEGHGLWLAVFFLLMY